ncbi:MAG: transcription antitermination factor NusB [Ruminococcaceae bacterium]|nr:transcription antitermination factor NusB [Oscillospiraceae bacterium]
MVNRVILHIWRKLMNRTKAREYAFILLFQYKFQPNEIMDILEEFCMEYNPGIQEEYIRTVVTKVAENVKKIDEMIEKTSDGWGVDRISTVNLSLLRLAVGEMLYVDNIPAPVSVNEAVGLAKVYDGEESVAFMNGVLDKIRNNLKVI